MDTYFYTLLNVITTNAGVGVQPFVGPQSLVIPK